MEESVGSAARHAPVSFGSAATKLPLFLPPQWPQSPRAFFALSLHVDRVRRVVIGAEIVLVFFVDGVDGAGPASIYSLAKAIRQQP